MSADQPAHHVDVAQLDELDRLDAEKAEQTRRAETLVDQPELRRLAELLHQMLCRYDHTEGCGWLYEKDNWTSPTHVRWRERAERLIGRTGRSAAELLRILAAFPAELVGMNDTRQAPPRESTPQTASVRRRLEEQIPGSVEARLAEHMHAIGCRADHRMRHGWRDAHRNCAWEREGDNWLCDRHRQLLRAAVTWAQAAELGTDQLLALIEAMREQ